jgi:transcriptional regulator with XRE-family HTH domain
MHINEERLYRQIGEHLRQTRAALGVTQSQVAEATGLLRTSVTNIEAGRQKAPLHVLYRLCAFLGTEVAAVLPEIGMVVEADEEIVTAPYQLESRLPRTAAFLKQLKAERQEEH